MTFSIIVREGDSFGVGVVSGSVGVGDRVPWAREGVGAVVTQAYTETKYGSRGVLLLERGVKPREILRKLTKEDPDPDRRQVAIMGREGEVAVHTGSSCPRERSSKRGEGCVAVGNMLENKKTVSAMIENFEKSEGKLAPRIITALKSGADVGGDRRGNRTAALVVRGEERVDLGIYSHRTPIEELESGYVQDFCGD